MSTPWLMEATLSERGGCDRLGCDDMDQRRTDVLAHPTLNGISFVEVDPADHRNVHVHFLKPVPAGGFGLVAQPGLATIDGGVRITGITVVTASASNATNAIIANMPTVVAAYAGASRRGRSVGVVVSGRVIMVVTSHDGRTSSELEVNSEIPRTR